jgi:hypothetical protein
MREFETLRLGDGCAGDWETAAPETGRRARERVSVTIHSASGVLLAVMFEGTETVSLALDDERLVEINRALGLAGACVDFATMEGGAR